MTKILNLKLRTIIYAGALSGSIYIRALSDKTLPEILISDLIMLAILVVVGLLDKEYQANLTNPVPKWWLIVGIISCIVLIYVDVKKYYP